MVIKEARSNGGKVYLTDTALIFGKSELVIPFNNIEKVETYRYVGSGGITLFLKNGKKHKFPISKKKDFEEFYDYLSRIDFSSSPKRDNTVCTFCGAKVVGKYCSQCGKEHTVVEAEENTPTVCWSCGEPLKEGAAFCHECGTKQDVNKLLVRIGGEIAKKYVTTVCPRCHSKNIKIYRKGYDYRPGFWGALFGVRGAGYVGGFDANKACCHCMDCGKDWETDYDYRKL